MEHKATRDSRELHVVIGAGVIGSGVARLLADQDRRVRVVTRSGSRPSGIQAAVVGTAATGTAVLGTGATGTGAIGTEAIRTWDDTIEAVAGDAADTELMARLADGASVIYNCANPPYHRWPVEWPPIAASLLAAAERSGAVLVTISNLYGYGPARLSLGADGYDPAHPMTEETPLAAAGKKGMVRAQMWRDALAAHHAGRVRATEVRASDYVGPGAGSVIGERAVPRIRRGQGVTVLGRTDRLHTWSFTQDVAAMAVVAGRDPKAWGKAWHAPSGPPLTQRDAVTSIARAAGVAPVPVRRLPPAMLRVLGVGSALMRELTETEYQFSEDFVMDSSAAQHAFGLAATPWELVLSEIVTTLHGGEQS
jgi:nucleoside-diphosphate-sugar epimerase